MGEARRAALYVRVSTDQHSVESQIRDLTEEAERRGWTVVEIYRDAGISGAKRRDQRPGLDATKPKITISSANALIPQRALPFIKRRLYQTGFLLAQMTFKRATHFAPESAAVTHACSSRSDLAAAK